jgi:DNA mismatch repair protein MLH1
VDRIAAGEIIHRPASALKELLENCIDAGSSRVAVTLRDGGLHTLSITDNGCGIRVTDFPILCERFTTSKLTDYSDLRELGTFGFRGEALASITHVARVTITSMTRGATCAYKASFSDGKMVCPDGPTAGQTVMPDGKPVAPKACAGVQGTVIHVEDLFYNVPIRRAALRNAHSEEYARCIDMLSKYAIHYSGRVSISCKKAGQGSKLDLNTPPGSAVTVVDNIRTIYGPSVARELLPLEARLDDSKSCTARGIEGASHLRLRGWVSNANFSQKKLQLLLFINDRLVDSTAIRRAIDSVYARVLPKHAHPFVYVAIEMDPHILDVNVHPTKKEGQAHSLE